MKKRDFITVAILVLIFVVMFIILFITKSINNNGNFSKENEYNNLTVLKDEDMFLSVEKNINKICRYSNVDKNLLNFIVKDDINSKEYENTSFKAEQMHVISNLNLYKYYVKGNLYEDIVDQEAKFIKKEYFILNYDIDNLSYNIEIINQERYENALSEDYIFETINSNDYNRFEYNNLSQKSRAVMYFNDYVKKMYNNPDEAYILLSSDTKQKYFNTYEDFKNFIINHNGISISEFSVEDNVIGIKDNYNIEYIFEINYVLNYNVTINITEE